MVVDFQFVPDIHIKISLDLIFRLSNSFQMKFNSDIVLFQKSVYILCFGLIQGETII